MDNNKDIEKSLLEDDRISRFLQGMMDGNEEAAFLDELKSNNELRERASIQARLIKGMKQADEELICAFKRIKKTDINQIEKELYTRKQNRKVAIVSGGKAAILDEEDDGMCEPIKLPSIKNINKYIAAASIILIFFVGYMSYDYYATTSLGKEYANTFPMTSIVRGDSNESVESELTTLFENVVNDKDLDQTISRLLVLWHTAKQDTYNEYTDYAPYIGWHLAIAYLEDYKKDRAMDILEEMEQMYPEGTAIGDRIKELLIEL